MKKVGLCRCGISENQRSCLFGFCAEDADEVFDAT